MTRKNIKIKEDLFDRLKEDKPAHMNWPTYLEQQCLVDAREEGDDEVTKAAKAAEANTEEIKRRLDELRG